MLDIIKESEKQKYTVAFAAGEVLFLQGDDSKDLYILISGRLDVYKNDKKIAEFTEPGATVGEMSFLLEERRTATIKALTDVKTIKIPSGQIVDFVHDYPSLAHHVSLKLARRLEETTRIMRGLREFSDQHPDAIVMADKDNNILSWNRAAEKLYDRTWQQMKGYPLADLYQNSQDYQQFVEDVESGNSLSEKEMTVKLSDEVERFVSTSTTVLYDGHHNVEGYIFHSRDMTRIKDLERKYKRTKRWLVPASVLFGLAIVAFFFNIPYFSKGTRILDYKKEAFKDRIARDTRSITSALANHLTTEGPQTVIRIMQDYFTKKNPQHFGITGLILLNRDKKVIYAYSPKSGDEVKDVIGTSYSSIKFRGKEDSSHKIITLFRAKKENPMGEKGVEIAYEIRQGDGDTTNWLIFQLEMEHLNREYGIDTKILSKIEFTEN